MPPTTSTPRSLREALYGVYASPRLLHPLDRVVLRLVARVGGLRRAPRAHHVLVCPPGAGNIGDQAMVEAFLGGTEGPVVLVVRDRDDVDVPPERAGRVRVLPLRSLVYGGGAAHVRDVVRFAQLLPRARSVSVVGADLMDGGYGHRPAANLALVSEAAAQHGASARVLGFSWSRVPHPRALRAVRRAARSGTRLLARDPVSAARLRADGVTGVEEVLDTVFSAADEVDTTASEALLGRGSAGPVVVVNASGLVGSRVDQVADYQEVVRHLRRRGARVVLLPHVRRPGGDDLAELRRVAAGLEDDPEVLLVEHLLSPSQVRGLVDRADAVVTGRMHLAVMALSKGVPAVCLSTQGKVDGLMEVFGTPSLCVTPRSGMAAELVREVDGVLDDRLARGGALTDRAIRAQEVSRRNFAGLDAA